MVSILVEKDGEILKFPVKKFINKELDAKLTEYERQTSDDSVEVEEIVEEVADLKRYTFKNNEIFVSGNLLSGGNMPNRRAVVTVHRKYVDMKVDYGLQASDLRDIFYHNVLRVLRIHDSDTQNYMDLERILAKHLKHNHYKIHYKNRNGIYYSATFKDRNKPSSLSADYIFEVKHPELARFSGGTSLNMTHAKRPVLNNVYPQKTICWGRVTKAPILTSAKTIFEASERMLNFFLGSTFNRDLSSQINIDPSKLLLAIHRGYNEKDVTGISDEEYGRIKAIVLDRVGEINTQLVLQNLGFLLLMSVLNLDFSDVDYKMGE